MSTERRCGFLVTATVLLFECSGNRVTVDSEKSKRGLEVAAEPDDTEVPRHSFHHFLLHHAVKPQAEQQEPRHYISKSQDDTQTTAYKTNSAAAEATEMTERLRKQLNLIK